MSKRKKNGTKLGVAPSSGEVDRHLNTFECHEISRLYKHLIQVTKGDSLLSPAKYELAARSLSSLLKKLSRIQCLSIQAADEHTLHGTSLYDYVSIAFLIHIIYTHTDKLPLILFLILLFVSSAWHIH